MTEPRVLTSHEGGIATLTLNRPHKRNAFDIAQLEAFDAAFSAAVEEPSTRTIVLRGAGPAFSSGIDLGALGELSAPGGRPLNEAIRWIQGIFNRVADAPVPVVAALHGTCIGLALELALAADIRLVEAGTTLSMGEIVLGIIPDCGGTTRLSRLVGPARAKLVILTGDRFDADEAFALGMVERVAPTGELAAAVNALSGTLARRSPRAVRHALRIIDAVETTDRAEQLELEVAAQCDTVEAPEFGEYLQRGMAELLAKR